MARARSRVFFKFSSFLFYAETYFRRILVFHDLRVVSARAWVVSVFLSLQVGSIFSFFTDGEFTFSFVNLFKASIILTRARHKERFLYRIISVLELRSHWNFRCFISNQALKLIVSWTRSVVVSHFRPFSIAKTSALRISHNRLCLRSVKVRRRHLLLNLVFLIILLTLWSAQTVTRSRKLSNSLNWRVLTRAWLMRSFFMSKVIKLLRNWNSLTFISKLLSHVVTSWAWLVSNSTSVSVDIRSWSSNRRAEAVFRHRVSWEAPIVFLVLAWAWNYLLSFVHYIAYFLSSLSSGTFHSVPALACFVEIISSWTRWNDFSCPDKLSFSSKWIAKVRFP